MPQRLSEAAAVAAIAVLITGIIAAMVIWKPSERLFGLDIVGPHHDPFTVMEQFRRPFSFTADLQPVTDLPGILAARRAGVVAAYNWLILLTFPLSAVAAYLLARHLALSRLAATVAALAYAFSPFHLAHAAYHLHIAQTQWIPLYLLALWRCLDHASWRGIGLLAAAVLAVTFSNLYAGLIAAVTTPLAGGAYWWVGRGAGPRPIRRLALTASSLVLVAALGFCALTQLRSVTMSPTAQVFPRADLFRYSARWWSYAVPPVASPLFGDRARRIWSDAGVREGLLEQQVSLGWGVMALAGVAVVGWSTGRRLEPANRYVPVLASVAVFAVVCSLSPERSVGAFTFVRPSALLYPVVPMFRSYARFGVVVQLMAAVLAGIGIDRLRRIGTRPARLLGAGLAALAVAEYAVLPSKLWRDVLPTSAHRWAVQQPGARRVLDCTLLDQQSASIASLTGERIVLLGGPIPSCTDARLPEALAANGFTHLLVRRRTPIGHWFADRAVPDGLLLAARFPDGLVFAVTAPRPLIYTASMKGIASAEPGPGRERRWMEPAASWTVVNTSDRPLEARLDLELSALHRARLEVILDGRSVQTLAVDEAWQMQQVGPLTLGPGHHEVVFRTLDGTGPGAREPSADHRQLALGQWTWVVRGERP
ncbi:MAG: hypothetical protein ABIX28_23490 [Vicinamibacterales bacterium]